MVPLLMSADDSRDEESCDVNIASLCVEELSADNVDSRRLGMCDEGCSTLLLMGLELRSMGGL